MRRPTVNDLLMGEFKFRPFSGTHHQTDSHSSPHKPSRAIGKKGRLIIPKDVVLQMEPTKGNIFRYVDDKRVQVV